MLDRLTWFADGHHWAIGLASALVAAAGVLVARRARGRSRQRSHDIKLREAIEAMSEGLAFYDPEDRIVVWNRRYAELNGESGALLKTGAPFRDLLQAGLRAEVYPEAAGREAEWLETRLAQRRGGDVVLEQENQGHWLRIVERRTADGGVVSICEDITDLKQREASFRLLFEGNPVPMWVTENGERRFVAVNKTALARYGYDRDTFLGMTLHDIISPDQHPELDAALAQEHETSPDGTWRHRIADGSEIEVQPYMEQLLYEGRPARLTAVFDVTVRKRAEEAMAQARDQAEAANRAKSEFLANMSHEIRTPLNGVTGVAEVLARTPLSEPQLEMVRVIESSAQTLERLLSDILDLSRVESGRIDIEHQPFDLVETIEATAALSELRAREKGIGFELRIDSAARGLVLGDAGRLKQILYNLLSNAVKFTQAGGVSLTVAVEANASPPVFTFVVADTGVGFEPSCKERLFGRFEQEDGSITRQFGGTGLGLAISRELAHFMGGRLEAESEPGRGARFTLSLPMPRTGVLPTLEWEAAPAFTAAEARPLRILLAEDHPINQKVVELMLASLGVQLTCVENGEEAVHAAATERFDVVLMDMQMPVMDGLTAIRAIRSHESDRCSPRTPIFTLSANAMTEHLEASMAAGADRHLTKPITASVLLGALGEIAEQVALREAA